jgi:signal transduction histidine kinase
MIPATQKTCFASAERLSEQEVERQNATLCNAPLIQQHLDLIPEMILILNEQRQIVFANQKARSIFNQLPQKSLLGMRQGELFNCIHAHASEGGCGTTNFCHNCGAINAILNALDGSHDVQECRILAENNETAYDFRVTSAPYFHNDERFVFFTIVDISDEKRRKVLERIFFHDVNNTLQVLVMSANMLVKNPETKQAGRTAGIIYDGIQMLANEIGSQQDLLAAEDGHLHIRIEKLHSERLLNEIIALYSHYECASGKNIVLTQNSCNTEFRSDRTQLGRVIGNMLKNALEATAENEVVAVGCELPDNNTIRFRVNNPQFMELEVQQQVFNRSFTTKGSGRGVGTYSIKLLGERYLMGRVNFTSTPAEGTTFMIDIPL